MKHSTSQHFQPLALVEDFEFEGWEREGEIGVYPPHFDLSEEVPHQPFKRQFEVVSSLHHHNIMLANWEVFWLKDPHCLHLMEYWVVELVDFVPTVDIPEGDELWVLRQQFHFVCCRMGPQHLLPVDVVGVRFLARDMVGRHQDRVEVFFEGDYGTELIEDLC